MLHHNYLQPNHIFSILITKLTWEINLNLMAGASITNCTQLQILFYFLKILHSNIKRNKKRQGIRGKYNNNKYGRFTQWSVSHMHEVWNQEKNINEISNKKKKSMQVILKQRPSLTLTDSKSHYFKKVNSLHSIRFSSFTN